MPTQSILLPQKNKRDFVGCEEIRKFIAEMSQDHLFCMDFTGISAEKSYASGFVSESDTKSQDEAEDRRNIGQEMGPMAETEVNLRKVSWIFANSICLIGKGSELTICSPEEVIHLLAPYLVEADKNELVLVGLAQGRLQRASVFYLRGLAEEILQLLDFLGQELLVGSDSFFVLQRRQDGALLMTKEDQERMQRLAVAAELLDKAYLDHLLWSQKGGFVSCRESRPELFDPYRIPPIEPEVLGAGGE